MCIRDSVHIEKFYQLEKNKGKVNTSNFQVAGEDSITLNDISFKYFNSDEYIFDEINLEFQKNKHTIMTGPNGSGKSTLLGLISGVYYSNRGIISSFSDKFGYIGATPLIFDGTLYENLIYGNAEEVDENEMVKYLKHLDTFKEEAGYVLDRRISNKLSLIHI